MIVEDIRLPPFACPICGYVMDGAMSISSEAVMPKEGDLSVCAKCLAIGFFQQDLSVRVATSEECEHIPDVVREFIAFCEQDRRRVE